MTKRQSVVLLTAAAVSAALAVAAVATPPSGILSGTVVARGSFVDAVDIKLKVDGGRGQEVIQVRDARETVMQQIVIGPGGQTGWHSHPGPVVVLVKGGELTLYTEDDCAGRTYSAGQAFIDSGQGHAHVAYNHSPSENTELWVTYFDVPPGQPFRLDAPNPGTCGF
ncbi:MAG TPA: cupin domain-containing protein [Thermoanaerobaculia bacterium]|nr:cupin domain-containing protein [Thermoanaerobaculia bacterium]